MIIRKAELEDAKGIGKVLMESYNINSIDEWADVFINETEKKHFFLVAEENKEIVGLISWKTHGLLKHQLAELSIIAVLPQYRGRGISQKLFKCL